MTIGEKIKHHRKLLGFTQTELGERLGVKKNAVSKWECGRVDDIPASKIKLMAELFSVPLSYLIDEEVAIEDEEILDAELVSLLTELTPDEIPLIVAYIQGIIAARNKGNDNT